MSFTATAVTTRGSSQLSNGGRRGTATECQHEKAVRRNIQQIRTNLQSTDEHLENLSRRMVSRRIVETLHERLKQTYQIVVETEGILAEWEANLAGHPFEKHKRKFSFEKLKAHFEAEVDRVKEVSQRVQSVATHVAHQTSPMDATTNHQTQYDGRRAGRICGGTGGSSGGSDFVTGTDYDDFTMECSSNVCDGSGRGGGGGMVGVVGGKQQQDNNNADILLLDDPPPTSIVVTQTNRSSSAVGESDSGGHNRHKGDTTGGGLGVLSRVGWSRGVNREAMVASADSATAAWQPLPCVATAGVGGRNQQWKKQQLDMSELEDSSEHDCLLQRSVADDRLRGIKKIEHQVAQANQIFRDLASLVVSQDSHLDSLDSSLQTSSSNAKGASLELQKAYSLQRNTRRRRLFLFLFVCILLVVVFFVFRVPSPQFLQHRTPATAAQQQQPPAPVQQQQLQHG
eukprot:GHVS01079741.1.p1 GENE.GHVS01079741.1~~GHVS01079741.1.p1  ORF type:complete len:456 (+),score=115.10 GHVS01079741.1:234-1601(+)